MNSADFWSITIGALFVGSIVFLAFVGVLRWMLRIDKIVELLEKLVEQKNAQETTPEEVCKACGKTVSAEELGYGLCSGCLNELNN